MTRFLNERAAVLFTLLLVAVSLLYASYTFDFSDVGSAHSPVFFPQIILFLWIALTVIALMQAVWIGNGGDDAKPVYGLWRLALLILAILIYSYVIVPWGFFLSSIAFAVLCLPVFGLRNPVIIALYAIAVPGALVVLFNHTLGMPLPTSSFTHYF